MSSEQKQEDDPYNLSLAVSLPDCYYLIPVKPGLLLIPCQGRAALQSLHTKPKGPYGRQVMSLDA